MKYFEMLEEKIDADLDKLKKESSNPDESLKKAPSKKGIHVNRQMLLDASQCDELHEIESVSDTHTETHIIIIITGDSARKEYRVFRRQQAGQAQDGRLGQHRVNLCES